jgi:hypothetical protein
MRFVFGFILALAAVGASNVEYFPAGSLGETPRLHQFMADWYSKHLAAMQEPSIWQISRQKPADEVYRFLYLRSFHHPISVRIAVASDGTGLLISKETNGRGGYQPGALIRNTAEKLTRNETQRFRDTLDHFGFWKLPTRGGPGGCDGAEWIVEASKDGRYQLVDRWSPPPSDPIHSLGMMFMTDLAHFKLLHEDVY